MEHAFFGSFQLKISGSNGTSEKVVLFFRTEYSNRKFAFLFFQAISLIPVSGLRGRFPVNRTDLICTYGKRDSGAKFTSPKFLRTICLNHGPTGLLMQMVNNQCECSLSTGLWSSGELPFPCYFFPQTESLFTG